MVSAMNVVHCFSFHLDFYVIIVVIWYRQTTFFSSLSCSQRTLHPSSSYPPLLLRFANLRDCFIYSIQIFTTLEFKPPCLKKRSKKLSFKRPNGRGTCRGWSGRWQQLQGKESGLKD
ncbi:Hypothetical predicted protein [Olea europaea subsp. europaea]|uniref:Uncharacterized protein n=1 Tax=Olea europaea subsp. europaea TaxID=158383 RepID=A0A8S0TW96_OLEEU|nr:Hypothetical predicted protein [Olea europaea subsp. europaea]